MLALISPAKTLDFTETPLCSIAPTVPTFLKESNKLNKTPKEIECRDFHLPDPPSNPMVFGKWKDDMYLLVSRSVKRNPSDAIAWLSQVEQLLLLA